METFLCQKCRMLFYADAGLNNCTYCNHLYVVWITYKERSKKEVETILKEVAYGKA